MERDARPGALPALEPAFRHELRVGGGNGVPREPEFTRQRPRGWKAGAGSEPPASQRVPERPLERAPHSGGVDVEMEIDTANGP